MHACSSNDATIAHILLVSWIIVDYRLIIACLMSMAAFAADVAIQGATVLPVSSEPIENGTVLIRDGTIAAVGQDVSIPEGTTIVDASGMYLMPGIIDVHSHMGVYPWPSARAHGDGNEATAPITARVRAEDSVHVSDPAISRARAGGVTTIQVLPGSANLVGGEVWLRHFDEHCTRRNLFFDNCSTVHNLEST